MDADSLVAGVRTARETELDRLASDRRLLAVTGADMSTETVLRSAASTERAAARTFETWAATEGDETAAAAFEDVAATERAHLDRLLAELEDPALPEPETPGALHEHLRELSETPARVGAGLVGRPLVGSGTQLQFVSFFVNEADSRRADLFRELRADTDAQLETGRELLDGVCDSAADWTTAETAATAAVEVAYEEYATALETLGVDPKPVC